MTHDYFDRLAAHPKCAQAIGLRDQAEIDSFPEAAQSSDRQPIVYDPEADAALLRFYPQVSCDIKGRYLPLDLATRGLITWDFWFDESWQHPDIEEAHQMVRHKTWRINPDNWLAIRTDYRHAANVGQFSEVMITMPGKKYTAPPESWRQTDDINNPANFNGWFGEMLQPRLAEFFYQPNTVTRVWLYIDGFDRETCTLSVWVADETRDPVELYRDLPLHPTAQPLKEFFIEYDTSADQMADCPIEEYRSWNRNYVVLLDVSKAEVLDLLERPGAEGPGVAGPGVPGAITFRSPARS